MGPSDPHPNWHLGMRGTQHRAVMWRVWKEGGTGFLYWGANCYEKATVPSAEVSRSTTGFKLRLFHGFIIIWLIFDTLLHPFSRLNLGGASLQVMESCTTLDKSSHLQRNPLPLYDLSGF